MIQICLFLYVVLLVSSVISTPSVGQCTRLVPSSVASALNSTCLDVVDYLFYLPKNVSIDYLDQLSRNRLSDSSLSGLPTLCQLSLKKAVCSSVYLKCHPDYVEGDYKTYNYGIFSDVKKTFALPFQRPCVSVCQNANSKCLGLLNLQGKALNCTSLTDYSRGAFGVYYGVSSYKLPHTYDLSPSSTVCNSMTAVGSVASTSEIYEASSNGACSGIINDLYVPPGNLISPNLAPMQGPHIVQSIIESQLASSFNQLPPWLSSSCHFALRKYFCGSYMLAPQPQRFGEVLVANNFSAATIQGIKFQLSVAGVNVSAYLKHTFYLPSYPSRQVCVDYRDSCGLFINASGLPSLIPKCDSIIRGIEQYPTTTQTISALPLSPTLVVKFQTQPNAMRSADDSSYSTMCPEGYASHRHTVLCLHNIFIITRILETVGIERHLDETCSYFKHIYAAFNELNVLYISLC